MGRLQRLKEVYVWLPAQTKVYVNIFAVFLLLASFMAVDAAYNSDMAKKVLRPKLYWTEQKAKIERLIAEDDEAHNARAVALSESLALAYAQFDKAMHDGVALYPNSPQMAHEHARGSSQHVQIVVDEMESFMREEKQKHEQLLALREYIIKQLEKQ